MGGMAGAGAGGGGGGAGGGPVASCDPDAGDDPCVTCMKSQCCPTYGPCFGNGDCACYVTCQNTTPGTCLFECGLAQVPAGAIALVSCTHQLCGAPCSP